MTTNDASAAIIDGDEAGTFNPETGTLDPASSFIYADWGLRTGVTALFPGDDEVKLFKEGTDAFLDALDGPSEIVMESTVHSFVPEDRAAFMARCAEEGHTLLFLPPRLTGRWTRELGMDKSDFSDPFVFKKMVEAGIALKRPKPRDEEWAVRRIAANRELMLLRNSGKKDAFAKDVIKRLPPYSTLDPVKRTALGNGKKYSEVAIAAAAVAAKHVNNRHEFERLCGLYAHGYPSQIRADLHHWLYAGGAKRARLNGEPTSVDPKTGAKKFGIRKRDDLTLSEWRRSLRWLYAQLRKPAKIEDDGAGTNNPEMGTLDPAPSSSSTEGTPACMN